MVVIRIKEEGSNIFPKYITNESISTNTRTKMKPYEVVRTDNSTNPKYIIFKKNTTSNKKQ